MEHVTGTGTVASNGHGTAVATSGSQARHGDDGDAEDPGRGPGESSGRPPGPSTRMALIVLGIAAVLTIVGSVASGLTGGQAKRPSTSSGISTAKGSPIAAMPSAGHLGDISASGLPPSDVVHALALPRGASVVSGSEVSSGVGLYDKSLGFVSQATENDVIGFFRAQLPSDLWHVLSKGPATSAGATPGAYRLIAEHPSSDGYEWELGVTVMPETFSSKAAVKGSTPFTLRLFQVSDAD